jgi:hypothetical protein
MASVPSSPSMNAMVDTITNAMENMFTNCNVAGPPRYVIHTTVRRALRDIDAGRAPCVASTASVRSPEPDAPRRASSSTPRASARGTSAPPRSLGALMEPHRPQCRSHRCRRRTSSRCRRRLQPYHRQLLPTGTAVPPEQEVGHRASPTTSTPPFLAHRLQLLLCAPMPTSPLPPLAQSAPGALPPRLRERTLPFTNSSAWDRPGRAQQSSSRGRPRRNLAGGPPWPAPRGHGLAEAGTGARGRRPARPPRQAGGRRPAWHPRQAVGQRPARTPRRVRGRWPASVATARRSLGRRRAWQAGCGGGGVEVGGD